MGTKVGFAKEAVMCYLALVWIIFPELIMLPKFWLAYGIADAITTATIFALFYVIDKYF